MSEPWKRRVEIGPHVLYEGDCLEILPTLGPVDAVVTDPPYGFGAYKTDKDGCGIFNVLPERAAVFGYPETLIQWILKSNKTAPDEWITWWPTNARAKGRPGNGLQREVESIAIWGDLLSKEPLKAARKDSGISFGYGAKDSCFIGDVWTEPSPGVGFNSRLRLHPNEKPVVVMARVIACYSRGGETILDPFMGSGTTGVACVREGRRFMGIELDPGYFEIAVERIRKEMAQPRLDLPTPEQPKQETFL